MKGCYSINCSSPSLLVVIFQFLVLRAMSSLDKKDEWMVVRQYFQTNALLKICNKIAR